ncbi:MAG: RodZ domain-containing protein [Herbaspirillum sp.]
MTDGLATTDISDDSVTLGSNVAAPTVAASQTPGQKLTLRRLENGWSVEQVAGQLKMAPRQIDALESDRLDLLPNLAVARGFMRSYAKLLKLDATSLLNTVQTDTDSPIETIRQRRPLSRPFEPTLPSMRTHTGGRWLLAVVLLVAASAVLWSTQHWNWVKIVKPLQTLVSQRQTSVSSSPAQNLVREATVSSVTSSTNSAIPSQTNAAEVSASTPAPDLAPVAVKESSVTTKNSTINKVLKLNVRQDSWIEIKGKSGRVFISRLAKAGTVETFDVVEPVSLVVGNAAGVDATLQGTQLDLSANTSTNVARINLE